jgi:hypothetical protein
LKQRKIEKTALKVMVIVLICKKNQNEWKHLRSTKIPSKNQSFLLAFGT